MAMFYKPDTFGLLMTLLSFGAMLAYGGGLMHDMANKDFGDW